jgi:ATP-dependent exoDNAse (exonuclease V) beta subunit
VPVGVLEPRLPPSGDLPRRRADDRGGGMTVRLTDEQRAAVEDRSGASLLAAGAGSGKTAVMVERFTRAVLEDEVAVHEILALTFTEKAAGELRERVRRRFLDLGLGEEARAVDAGWIGTIHGFCARVLRAQPLAAGLDPGFTVLDEGAARRLAAAAFREALDGWAARRGPALDLAAAYGPGLEELLVGAHAALRSRGTTAPRLRIPPPAPAPDPAALQVAAAAATACLAGMAKPGKRVLEALDALAACAALPADGSVPLPPAVEALKIGSAGQAKALEDGACEAYRAAWAEYRQACADHHARAAVVLIDDLLARYGTAYAAAKRERGAVDFEDLELGVRDLLAADPARRARWAERFALIMIDEFQDTNPLQLELLGALERDNLFAVGDEAQSIYGFRHADVGIFRARRAVLPPERVRGLTTNFRSREEILAVVNHAFAPLLGEGFLRLRAGRADAPSPPVVGRDGLLRLFDPDTVDDPRVELLLADQDAWSGEEEGLGLADLASQPWRRAEARAVAHRLRAEVDAGRPAGDLVVLVRATSSLRLYEQALEEQGLPTYVLGGRGYWSGEQVRDGLAYLSVLANPLDETALYAALASPFCGASSDALLLLADAGRATGEGAWAALTGADRAWTADLPPADRERLEAFARVAVRERALAERLPVEVLLDRAITATGYDLAVLARAGGERRLANLRKLMRLAREFERAEGRDLRAFIAEAAELDLSEAREGEAALESEGLDAVRLMTVHRAKGLEFPVVCVADLGRPGANAADRLLIGRDGRVGLRLVTLAGGDLVPALAWTSIAEEQAEEQAAEERRLLYVAATRAEERLIVSGGVSLEKRPAPRTGGPPLDWLAPALLGAEAVGTLLAAAAATPDGLTATCGEGRIALRLVTPATLPSGALVPPPRGRRASAPGTALPAEPRLVPGPPRPAPAERRLSYSQLRAYAACPYRFYLERVLRLPRVEAPPELEDAATPAGPAPLEARVRGSIVHALIERLDLRPDAPEITDAGVRAVAAGFGLELEGAHLADLRDQVARFARSPLAGRLGAARDLRREAAFAFAPRPGGGRPLLAGSGGATAGGDAGSSGLLVSGFVDAIAHEADGTALVVDYKTDRLGELDPAELVARDYATQRTVYALAALLDDGGGALPARAEVAYLFTERPETPVVAVFTQADVPALVAELESLAAGILAEEWPVTPAPHRALCGDCPGRTALCSWPERITLDPDGPAGAGQSSSLGSFAGSGGPS